MKKDKKSKKITKDKRIKKDRSIKKKRSIIIKLLALGLIPLLLLDIVITSFSTYILQVSTKNEIESSLKYITASLIETYSNLYAGDYNKDITGSIYKGKQLISGDSRLLDAIKSSAGLDATIYFGDMRTLTTIKRARDGARAVASSASPEVYEIVGKNGQNYFSEDLVIEGVSYYAYYTPLKNTDGTIMGMVFAGRPRSEVQAVIQSNINKIILLSSIIIIVASIITILISRNLSKAMKKTQSFLARISQGDLSAPSSAKYIKRKDEIGQIYGISVALQQELASIVQNIKKSSADLTGSADELSSMAMITDTTIDEVSKAIIEISNGASSQAQETQTATDNINNIGLQIDSIKHDVDALKANSDRMSKAERESAQILIKLNESNDLTIESIERIAKQTNLTNISAQNIQKAVGLIQSIAEETDLLSLNASIEAARAGDAGRGFAVVAEEIRKLADQSRRSANEIEDIIQKLLFESNTTVEVMKEVKTNISTQQERISETKERFTSVGEGIQASLENVDGITLKVSDLEQSKVVVLDIISTLSSISEENAAVTQQTSASTEELNETVTKLSQSSVELKSLSLQLEQDLSIFKL